MRRTAPLTPERWDDLEDLFGPRGATGGCWCMWWRLKRTDFDAAKGEGNRAAFRELVEGGTVPGLLLYEDDEPVGWTAVEPRANYPVLGRSRALKPLDDAQPWSVTCLFVRRGHRRSRVSVDLLRAAVDHAAAGGAELVEGYPVEPRAGGGMPDAFAWTGTVAAFRAAGFEEAGRGPTGRPTMRRTLR